MKIVMKTVMKIVKRIVIVKNDTTNYSSSGGEKIYSTLTSDTYTTSYSDSKKESDLNLKKIVANETDNIINEFSLKYN